MVIKQNPTTKLQIGDDVNAWGHKFTWTDRHISEETYKYRRYSYDELGEQAYKALIRLRTSKDQDLYALFRESREQHPVLQKFWTEVSSTPAWVDWDAVGRGQDVFNRYGMAITLGLAYQSLLGATGSNGRSAETLSRTGGFDLNSVRRRLMETTQFTMQCTESVANLRPDGDGFISILRVRWLHAAVRRRILDLVATRPSYYSVDENGIPINDSDSRYTIVTFSSTVIWQSLPRLGIHLKPQEIEDYLALWRLIAFYIGAPHDEFAQAVTAKATLDSMLLFEYDPTETSKRLARNIIRGLENNPPAYASRSLLETYTRWLNGGELSDSLGIGRPPWYYWVIISSQVALTCVVYNLARNIPAVDGYLSRQFRRDVWRAVRKKERGGLDVLSLFTFRLIPELDVAGKKVEPDVVERGAGFVLTADMVAILVALGWAAVLGMTVAAVWHVSS
jgi:hypothetical protein